MNQFISRSKAINKNNKVITKNRMLRNNRIQSQTEMNNKSKSLASQTMQ